MPQPARLRWVTEQRLTAFRFLFCLFPSPLWGGERGGGREVKDGGDANQKPHYPHPAAHDVRGDPPHKGEGKLLRPNRDETGHHHRIYLTKVGF